MKLKEYVTIVVNFPPVLLSFEFEKCLIEIATVNNFVDRIIIVVIVLLTINFICALLV